MALIEKLTAIADAVREKTGGDQLLTLDEIRDEITELSTVPTKPYIDSSLIEYSSFCIGGKNLRLLADPNLDTSQAENLENFLSGTKMSDIPAVQLSFPKAKYALRGFSSLGGNVSAENGMDISRLVLFLPSLVDAVRLFEAGRFGVMPTLHLSTACRNASRMFYGCSYLREVDLREADGVESFDVAFYNCSQLQTAKLNMQKVTNYTNTFYGCGNLTNLTIGSVKIKNNNFRLDSCPLLTVESLVGILNALESNAGEATTYTVVLGSENLAKLTDAQKQIAIDKNLTLA